MKNMKKLIAVVMAALLALTLAGCTAAAPTEAEARTFTVGFDCEYAPFGYIDASGAYDGFDLALAKEVCSRLGWEFKCVAIDWNSKDTELAAGNIDCIWNGFTKSEDRLDDYAWSVAYYDNSIVMVVRADSGITDFAGLAGKSVITQSGSSGLTALEEDRAELTATFKELLECADYNTAFMELDSGAVDAIAVDVGQANYQLSVHSGEYIILDEAVATEEYGIGFRTGDSELMYTVQGVLLEMGRDGTLMDIAEEYEDMGLTLTSITLN